MFLLVFDNQLLTCDFNLPSWWSDEYSEQFKGGYITDEQIKDFLFSRLGDFEKITPAQFVQMQTMVYQFFRREMTISQIRDMFAF